VALLARLGRQLAEVEGMGLWRQKNAGVGRGADHPEFALPQVLDGEAVDRGGRVDPPLHPGEGAADQGQPGLPVERVLGEIGGEAGHGRCGSPSAR
jgi:hypothetical protein